MKVGRKSVFDTKIKPKFDFIKAQLGKGASEKQVAEAIGVGYSTWLKHKAENKEFQEFLNYRVLYYVYKHTAPSNKVYIGITSQDPMLRWNNGLGYRNQKKFYSAIQKYGWDNIKHEILYSGLSKEDACQKEIELIAKYDSINNGYNVSVGGECGASGVVRSEETKKKMSESKKGVKHDDQWTNEILEAKQNKKINGGKRCTLNEILDRLDEIEEWSKEGATEETIAQKLGITRQTLWKYKNANDDIFNAIKRGRCVVVDNLRSALVKKALGFKYKETKTIIQEIEFDDGETKTPAKLIRTEIMEKYSPPDVAAVNLALKNYDKDNWSNDWQNFELKKQELEIKKQLAKEKIWDDE